jgi:hypothetical protein
VRAHKRITGTRHGFVPASRARARELRDHELAFVHRLPEKGRLSLSRFSNSARWRSVVAGMLREHLPDHIDHGPGPLLSEQFLGGEDDNETGQAGGPVAGRCRPNWRRTGDTGNITALSAAPVVTSMKDPRYSSADPSWARYSNNPCAATPRSALAAQAIEPLAVAAEKASAGSGRGPARSGAREWRRVLGRSWRPREGRKRWQGLLVPMRWSPSSSSAKATFILCPCRAPDKARGEIWQKVCLYEIER